MEPRKVMMGVLSSLAMVGLLGGVAKAMKEEDRIDGRALPGWECKSCSEQRFGLALVLRCDVQGRCSRL